MKPPLIEPYLFFNGCCEEAIEFYKSALDAEVVALIRFREAPEAPPPGTIPDGWEDKVMHALFRVGGHAIMASDGCGPEAASFSGFSLSLSVATAAEADRYFNALAEGGQITMPLGETFWSPRFGMVTDKFGLGWMIGVHVEQPAAGS